MEFPSAWSGSLAAFAALEPESLDAGLRPLCMLLQGALSRTPGLRPGWVALDCRLLRLGRRIDAAIVTERAIIAIQFRPRAAGFLAADRLAAEDAALDLADFHAGSKGVPIVPVLLVPDGAMTRRQYPLPLTGASTCLEATRLSLPMLLAQVARFPPGGLDIAAWAQAAYAPVPGLMEAACLLYAQHGVSALLLSQAGPPALAATIAAVRHGIAEARERGERRVIFVTGAPGAGKTLCGLDLAFAPDLQAAFLTANPALVHVLREALVRDAVARGLARRAAARRVQSVIQALPRVRDHYVAAGGAPSERVLVIDEAQRCWSAEYARRKTRSRAVALAQSEPAHLLDMMARRPGWAVLVCLVGGGQEIHDGEGGMAVWGEALLARPDWSGVAPPAVGAPGSRCHLPDLGRRRTVPALHLAAPVRSVGAPLTCAWVDAVLADRPEVAAALAREHGGVPFALTRSLDLMRASLRQRGQRTAGLFASSTARRLRAAGLGAVLPHQDDDAVSRWFLDRWPDIRSSDALEVVASEFAVQGLELDRAGLCWDADLIRGPGGWEARRFRATAWTRANAAHRANRLNAYRVLLTRARHGTVIWVPRGDARDPTRAPSIYDAVADYLRACGARALDAAGGLEQDAAIEREPVLL